MEAERFPISVRLTGVMHKEKSKMYMTSVLWSDQHDIIVYRSFQDFKKLHKQMKKSFSGASMDQSERIIPKFQDKKAKHGGQRKGHKSLARLPSLQKYCNALLSCDPRVCKSAGLIQFFHPKDHDLQPDFSKNSIIIMSTDDDTGDGTGHSSGGSITQPFVTETCKCIAPYETKDTKNKPFKVAADEKVDVLIKDKGGWWLVENEDKRMAWFPAPYLEKLGDDDDDEDDIDGTPETGMLCTAIKSYKATKDDELTVSIGAKVEVLQKSDNGWWLIRCNGKAGYVPSMYLQPYKYPHIRMTPHMQAGPTSPVLLSPSPTLSHQLSLSQGNLLRLPTSRSPSPSLLQPETKPRSRSLNVLSEQSPAPPARRTPAAYAVATPATANYAPPPTIMVEMDREDAQRGETPRPESEASFRSSSSDFSFSDDLSSSSASLTFNLSYSANDDRLRLSRTPPPSASNHLSPTNGPMEKMIPSVSDPNLYRGAASPKVPPRPRTQEILTRCTSMTRKKASRASPSPTPRAIMN